jgi:hypothetical protein
VASYATFMAEARKHLEADDVRRAEGVLHNKMWRRSHDIILAPSTEACV